MVKVGLLIRAFVKVRISGCMVTFSVSMEAAAVTTNKADTRYFELFNPLLG